MADRLDRVDGFLGRLLFRAGGLLCGVIALVCAYAGWWQFQNREPPYGWVPVILFGLASIAAASVIPYCFSRNRRLVEALDAMEDEVPGPPRRS